MSTEKINETIRDAVAALAAGRIDEAVTGFESALAEDPQQVDALLGLARAQLARRGFDEARRALERLVAVQPGHREGQSHLAMLEALGGDAGSGEAVAKLRALSQDPQAGFYEHFNLGLVLAAAGELVDAEAALERALAKEPASFHAAMELGQLALRRTDFAGAIPRLQAAARLAPTRSLPYALMARTHQARGERGKAIAAMAEAIKRAPTERPLFEQLYRLCLEAGAPKQAAGAAAELVRLDAGNAHYHALLGHALYRLDRFEDARRALFTAAEKDPEQARVYLERAAKLAPSEPDVARELADFHLERGAPDAAQAALGRALAAHPADGELNLVMARALRKSDRSRAIAHARKAAATGGADLKDRAEALLREL